MGSTKNKVNKSNTTKLRPIDLIANPSLLYFFTICFDDCKNLLKKSTNLCHKMYTIIHYQICKDYSTPINILEKENLVIKCGDKLFYLSFSLRTICLVTFCRCNLMRHQIPSLQNGRLSSLSLNSLISECILRCVSSFNIYNFFYQLTVFPIFRRPTSPPLSFLPLPSLGDPSRPELDPSYKKKQDKE